ncbi:hypothetical protein [Candidatus Frankia alpina]|uniref:hypothetical protein n=1 Tax=Candidatus Frankia alpina TaxID=2699483 RepID=UPI0013D8D841|nr:hypothetical protein [Candidatus Frankia alpina]
MFSPQPDRAGRFPVHRVPLTLPNDQRTISASWFSLATYCIVAVSAQRPHRGADAESAGADRTGLPSRKQRS